MDDRHLLPENIVSVHRVKLPKQVPVTIVEHMTDPRAAQLQMLFASLDERGKKTIVALAATMAKLHKDG